MSLPLRFKAVCTETGAESIPVNLREKVRSTFHNPDLCQIQSDWYQMPMSNKDSQLCQSTGLHDSKGKEVFFGDVLCDADGYLYVVDWNDIHACFGMQHFSSDWDKNIYVTMDICEYRCVIGNRFEPIETLKQRAGALTHE